MNKPFGVALLMPRTGMRNFFSAQIKSLHHFEVLLEADNEAALKREIKRMPLPDILIVDLDDQEEDIFKTIAWIGNDFPVVKLLSVTTNRNETAMLKALKLGVSGVLDSGDVTGFRLALTCLVQGEKYGAGSSSVPSVNERERSFLSLLSTELSYKEIASNMFVSPRTIEDYKSNLCKKFNVSSRVGLVLFALRHRIISLESYNSPFFL
jgi:two-component system, NarL family, invasion response regulator UvrY